MTASGYASGYAYGLHVGATMARWRIQENDRHIRLSGYCDRWNYTRAYWLGVRRGLRSLL